MEEQDFIVFSTEKALDPKADQSFSGVPGGSVESKMRQQKCVRQILSSLTLQNRRQPQFDNGNNLNTKLERRKKRSPSGDVVRLTYNRKW